MALEGDSAGPPTTGSTGIVYDVRMKFHAPLDPKDRHPEDPRRIWKIYEALVDAGCFNRCVRIAVKEAATEDVLLIHDPSHHATLTQTQFLSAPQLDRLAQQFDSVYLCPESAYCARLSCGGLIQLCQAVVTGHIRNGFAIIRPPGHHAEINEPMGFCLYNNVAIATRWVQEHYGIKKVLIVDWDVHHGNGIQEAFIKDPNVLYFSLHRYENAEFYPSSPIAACHVVGDGPGAGRTVNVAWPCPQMGDADYLHAFNTLLMPMAREFAPDLVIVACGFDAAKGDDIGECLVTPQGYAHMTALLKTLAGGRLVLSLEGGYNLEATAQSALACVQVLLGILPNPPPKGPGPSLPLLSSLKPSPACLNTIQAVQEAHGPYWKCFR
ncbi:hypothetical protein BJ085DRAFT_19691, partial [Dimargaris cristalligena]